MPDELVHELDERRHANTPRSKVLNEAALLRLHLEDQEEWEEAIREAREKIGSAYGLEDVSGEVRPK